MKISRRQAVVKMALVMGAAVVGPRLLSRDFADGVLGSDPDFSAADIALLDEIANTIIPDTDVPGAKAAKTGECIALLVRDCLTREERELFTTGLAGIIEAYERRFGVSFMSGQPVDRLSFLDEYNRDLARPAAWAEHRRGMPEMQCFRHLKQLTILGYFTSEIGCTQALRFVEVPGSFDGNARYARGDRNWSTGVR